MILTPEDTLYAYGKIHEAYDGVQRIDDYFRMKKMERIDKIPTPLFGMSMEDELFQNYDMDPNDMNFRILSPDHETFNTLLEMTASFTYEDAPGKEMKLMIQKRPQARLWGSSNWVHPSSTPNQGTSTLEEGDLASLSSTSVRSWDSSLSQFNRLGTTILVVNCL